MISLTLATPCAAHLDSDHNYSREQAENLVKIADEFIGDRI
ncbi:hypothetical protein [Oceanobacillus rekensis]|nr:hypothetical protein [Oceanobacillus rekensis]